MSRRALLLVAAIALFGVLPTPASATAPIRFTEHSVDIFCPEPLVGSTGVAELFFAGVSSEFGGFAEVAFWAGTSVPSGEPTLATDFESAGEGSVADLSVSITQPLLDVATGEPDGDAVIQATLAPAGDPEPFSVEERFGNIVVRDSGTIQPMTVETGTLQIAGETLSLEGCLGRILDHTYFQSQPSAEVFHAEDIFVFCDLTSEGAHGFLFAFSGQDTAFVEIGFDEPPVSGSTEEGVTLDLSTFDATVPMFDNLTGDPIGDALVDASITPGEEEIRSKRYAQNVIAVGIQQPLTVQGTLSVPTIDEPFDLSGCGALREDVHFVFRSAQGPQPGGTLPSNDTPDGAIEIAPGTRLTTSTNGAALEPEVPASCLTFEEDGEVQLFGRTVWYTIEGTDAPITIDTAGSRFDTAIAIYTRDDGIFTEIECRDDVFSGVVQISLQSAITFETDVGVKYYVQIGGFAGEFGRLRISVT